MCWLSCTTAWSCRSFCQRSIHLLARRDASLQCRQEMLSASFAGTDLAVWPCAAIPANAGNAHTDDLEGDLIGLVQSLEQARNWRNQLAVQEAATATRAAAAATAANPSNSPRDGAPPPRSAAGAWPARPGPEARICSTTPCCPWLPGAAPCCCLHLQACRHQQQGWHHWGGVHNHCLAAHASS